jgi:DNA-cytosine methyltransferase
MTHGSLFSGIGGFDLAAQWMGWENIFHCEWNPICQRVLKYHFPKSISYEDITKTDFTVHRGRIDLITGGFPCQPYSMAGKRLGKDDERHLFPEMLRAIREIQPSWVVGENVFGLVNWNGGLVFEEVQSDLETEGYEVQPFILPACAVNAPHRRDRVWFIAYRGSGIKGEKVSTRNAEKALNGVAGHGAQVVAPDTQRIGHSQPIDGEIKREFFEKQGKKGTDGSSVCVESVKANGLRGNAPDTEGLRINRKEEYENNRGQGGKWRGCDPNDISEIQSRDSAADTRLQRQAFSEQQTTNNRD